MDKQEIPLNIDEEKLGTKEVPTQPKQQTEQNEDKIPVPMNVTQIINRENSRRELFETAILLSLVVAFMLYLFFICFILFLYKKSEDWHIALMIVLPATTILLSIVHALKYKDPNDKPKSDEEGISIPQVKELVEILKPLKELFTLKSSNDDR